MKRVLDYTPSWAVVPVSVLGASLLLALAHTLLDSGTPPVARHDPAISPLSDPSQQLLPGTESKATASAIAVDALTNGDGVNSGKRLASSDAVSVLAPVDTSRRVNTGWHPMISDGAAATRPVALVSTHGYVPQTRMVQPAPRYGSNVSQWQEMPLVAPVENRPEPAESTSLGLINSLFAPPILSKPSAQVARELNGPTRNLSGEEPKEALPPRFEPLPAVEVSEAASVAPNQDLVPPLLPFPPLQTTLPDEGSLATVETADPTAEAHPEPQDGTLIALPPVDTDLVAPVESLPSGIVRVEPEPAIVATEDGLVPLPPVDSVVADSGVEERGPTLIPFPPVEPRLLDPQGSLAIAMIEGMFQPIEAEADSSPQEPEDTTSEPAGDMLGLTDDDRSLVAMDNGEEVPLPLPPVVCDTEGQSVDASSGSGESDMLGQYERSWELELIAREADKHSRRGFELANKKAYFSARLEFTRALRIMAQGLDTELQTNRHSQALAAGLRALTEAEDFLPKDGHLEAELDLAVIAGAHRTPVLHESEVDEMTPLAAIQEYHAFAQEKMAESVSREVAGSMALCGLGKLHITIGNQQRGDGIAAATPKAMVLLQAALIASPGNHMAANELGVLLARNGRYSDARRAFEHSIATNPTAEAWRNLALTCEQLGEMDTAYEAAQQTLALRSKSSGKKNVTPSRNGAIRWVSPAELAKSSAGMRTASAAESSDRPR